MSSPLTNFPKEFVKREHSYEGGSCIHCGETVANAAWLNCVDRFLEFDDFPESIKSYANYRGLKYKTDGTFVQPYGDTYETVSKLTKI